MRVVIAMDSFKGSMSSLAAGEAAKRGILSVCDAEVTVLPVADGGEGTTLALTCGLGGSMVAAEVKGPLGTPVWANYGILPDRHTAVMEMAAASGLTLVPETDRDPLMANTFGVGQMILDAIRRGCDSFLIGIGGSATTEGGIGMLNALGYSFLDIEGRPVPPEVERLHEIVEISDEKVSPEVLDCEFRIACDVRNPLCGEEGSVRIFGGQKGVREADMDRLDGELHAFADVTAAWSGKDLRDVPGAGAAGGLGFAFLSYLPHAELRSGIGLVLDAVGMQEAAGKADIVLTGEGRIDRQTRMGKVPFGVAEAARKAGCKKVIAFGGSVVDGAADALRPEIDECFGITPEGMPLEEAMKEETAKRNMEETVRDVFRSNM